MRRLKKACGLVAAALLAACAGAGGGPRNYGDPTVPTEPGALFLSVESPPDFAVVDDASLVISGAAKVGSDTPSVSVRQGDATVLLAASSQRYEGTVTLAFGDNLLRIAATSSDGKRSELVRHVTYRGSKPGLVWLQPASTGAVGGATVRASVAASPSEGRSITGVKFSSGGAEVSATAVGSAWSADVALPTSGTEVTLRAVATDSAGEATLTTRTFPRDANPPTVSIGAPHAGEIFATSSLEVSGTASDDLGVARVLVAVDAGDPETAIGTTAWTARLALEPGDHTIVATAVDTSGQRTSASVRVSVSRIVTLRPPSATGDITLGLDANGLDRLIPAEDQKRLTLLYVDLGPVLQEGLKFIKNPELHNLDTSGWGTAERNMQRLLLMSPDNADLRGTSLEAVLTLAPNLGLPPGRLLADIAGVVVDSPFLSESDVSSAIIRNLIETHPNIDTDPSDGKKKVRASLYDALRNFTTLGPKFGACSGASGTAAVPTCAGRHPGFLVGGTFARALRNNFKMTVTASSNLTPHDGVNPEVGKAYLFVLSDPSMPQLLNFDFESPTRFKIEGLADAPTVDMTFFMGESPQYFAAAHNQTARPDGLFYKGANGAWALGANPADSAFAPWLIEHLVIDGIYQSKRARFADAGYVQTYRYDVGAIRPAATMTWEKGWISTVTAGGLGSPPQPAYFWDHLVEAAQKRLHDGNIGEGQARVQFALKNVPLGLSGPELKDRLRPQMEAQKADLSRIIVGDRSTYNSSATFYLALGTGTSPAEYLFFTAPGDIPGASPYPYSKPGFFSDAGLTTKVSTTAAGSSGDTSHEKVPATAPATYYLRGVSGKAYKVELLERTVDGLRVRVVPVGA